MAFVHSKASRVLVNETHQSGYVTGYTVKYARSYGDATTLLEDGTKYIPGLTGGSVSVQGLFDSTAGTLHDEVNSVIGTDNGLLVTVLPDGFTLGSPALMAVCDVENYTVDASVNETVKIGVEAMPDDGVDIGVSLHAHSAETADGNGTGVDNAASSSGGSVAALHVTAYSGLTNAVIKVQHSSDNSTFADLITFTTATGVTSERKTTTGTVNRYVRALWDVTGTGSVTSVVAFARR